MTASEIQNFILDKANLKTSVKIFKNGSMKGYVRIMPIYQNGSYPSIPREVWGELKELLSKYDYANFPLFCGYSEISVFGIEDDRIQMKKEAKPKEIAETKVKHWGSKNSQMRLDKAAARYADKIRSGKNVARYY